MRAKLLIVVLLVSLLAACAPKEEMPTAVLPAGKAYADGKEIFFVHTEASDADVAQLLTDMMSSPVVYVPSLADVPDVSLANVYVFDNGLEGMGPFGFQADVFDNPPGTDGYSPLRRVNVVTWADPSKARMLTSVVEIMSAKDAGEVTIAQPGVVVNMPFVVWDGGQR
ncbi:MAG TPA: hypothetical protein VLT51_01565 [Anaerolineales bacterium]|nr:hypothetical protein [Anaerolineales bacterium]